MKVLFQWSSDDSFISIGTKGPWKHTDIAELGFKCLIQLARDFVFKVLRCNDGVKELSSSVTQHCVNISARPTEVSFVIKSTPELENAIRAGSRSDVHKDTNFGPQNPANSIKYPPTVSSTKP